MPNLLTQYDNGTFEATLATWNALFVTSGTSAQERSNDFADQGVYSAKLTTAAINSNTWAGGLASFMRFQFPATAQGVYALKVKIRVSAGIPDDVIFFLSPSAYNNAGDYGFLEPIRASAAKGGFVELAAYYYAATSGGNSDVFLSVAFQTNEIEASLEYANDATKDLYSSILDFTANSAIPAGEFIYVDSATAEALAALPAEENIQLTGRKLYYVRNVFYLVVAGTQIEIEEPIKWDTISIQTIFDTKTKAYRFEFSDKDVLLEFDNNAGRTAILAEIAKHGTNARLELWFGEINQITLEETIHFKGSFTPEGYHEKEHTVQCNIERRSFEEKLRTNFDVKTNVLATRSLRGITLDPIPTKKLFLHPRLLTYAASFEYNENVDVAVVLDSTVTDPPAERQHTVPPFKVISNNIVGFSEPAAGSGTLIYAGLTLEPGVLFRRFYFDAELSFKFTMGNTTQVVNAGFSIFKVAGISLGETSETAFYGNATSALKDFRNYGNVAGTKNYGASVNGYIDLYADEAIFIKCYIYTANNAQFDISDFEFTSIETHRLEVNEQTVYAASIVSAPLIHDVVNKQLETILDVKNPLKSDLFGTTALGYAANGCAANHFALNGLILRNFAGKPFNLSGRDCFHSLDGIFCLGMSVERDANDIESVRLEPIEYFFRDTMILKLFIISSSYDKRPAEGYLFNELEFGFKKYPQNGQSDSIEDFMTKKMYVTPLTKVKHKLSVIIDFILSGNYIEYTRRESFRDKPKETYETDNDTFLISATEATTELEVVADFENTDDTIRFHGIVPLLPGDVFEVDGAIGANAGTYTVDTVEISFDFTRTIVHPVEPVPADQLGVGFTLVLPEARAQAKRDEDFSSVDNVSFQKSVYNLEHHIKRIVLRWAKIFQTGWAMYVRDEVTESITFTSGANNDDATTELKDSVDCTYGDSLRLDRRDSGTELINQMDKPLFSENIIEFDAPLTWTAFNYIRYAFEGRNVDGKDYGYIKYVNPHGAVERGHVLKTKFKPNEQICTFTLIERYNG